MKPNPYSDKQTDMHTDRQTDRQTAVSVRHSEASQIRWCRQFHQLDKLDDDEVAIGQYRHSGSDAYMADTVQHHPGRTDAGTRGTAGLVAVVNCQTEHVSYETETLSPRSSRSARMLGCYTT